MFKGIHNVYSVDSVDLQFFRRKDNIKDEQKSSTPNLLIHKKAKFFCRAIGIEAEWRRPWLRSR